MEYYDLIVKCENLRDLNKEEGWPVLVKDGMFSSEKESYLKVIAVSGCYNVGKSFVLNNLGALNLPSSDRLHTEGLSVRFLNKDIVLIDTAGTNSPIKVANKQSLADRICMEKVLANCLRELADFHICVVNKLTWQDQQHYEMLFDAIEHSTQLWPLIIIHNFRDHVLEELKYLIDEIHKYYPDGRMKTNRMDISYEKAKTMFTQQIDDILKGYGSHKQQSVQELQSRFAQEPMIWFDSRGNDKCRHFFLVKNEKSGIEFNFKTFTHIKEVFPHAIAKQRTFSIKNIRSALDLHTRRYLRFENMDQIDYHNQPILDLIENVKNAKKQGVTQYALVLNKIFRSNTIKLKDLYELEYHNLYLGATVWNPRYDIVYTTADEIETCWVIIELPGKLKKKLEYKIVKNSTNNCIEITLSGEPAQEDFYIDSSIIKGNPERHFSKFDFKVTIPAEYDANMKKPHLKYAYGVYWIGLDKITEDHIGEWNS